MSPETLVKSHVVAASWAHFQSRVLDMSHIVCRVLVLRFELVLHSVGVLDTCGCVS